MENLEEKYNAECKKVFLRYKKRLYKRTDISNSRNNYKYISLEDFEIYNNLSEKIEAKLLKKLTKYPPEKHSFLGVFSRHYAAKFFALVNLE